jgi:Skp family chaperone for outer membrane proteins
VLRVLGVDPPEGERSEPLAGPKPVDVARAALAEFADESAKVRLQTGDVSGAWTNHRDAAPETSGDGRLLAFVNGTRTREAVVTNLQDIFDANTRSIAILDLCKGGGAPFVQAGIADFMERDEGEYHFRLFSDLTSGMAKSNLGIVYADEDSAEVESCLAELGHLFSERMDPLWLARREQEMIGIVNTYRDEAESLGRQHQGLIGEYDDLEDRNKELQKRVSQLDKRKTQLQEINAGLKEEKKDLQKRASQLEKRVSQLDKRKTQLQEINARLKEEKKEIQSRVSRLDKSSSRLQERNATLREEKSLLDSQLNDYRTSGRYKLADSVTKNVLRIPGAKALARRSRPKE